MFHFEWNSFSVWSETESVQSECWCLTFCIILVIVIRINVGWLVDTGCYLVRWLFQLSSNMKIWTKPQVQKHHQASYMLKITSREIFIFVYVPCMWRYLRFFVRSNLFFFLVPVSSYLVGFFLVSLNPTHTHVCWTMSLCSNRKTCNIEVYSCLNYIMKSTPRPSI